jgi:hypothetical protein
MGEVEIKARMEGKIEKRKMRVIRRELRKEATKKGRKIKEERMRKRKENT